MERGQNPRMSQAAADLGPPDLGDHQGWGIGFADAARLPEFIAYDRAQQGDFDEWAQEYHLGELLLESANDALLDGVALPSLVEEAVMLVVGRWAHGPTLHLLEGWTGLDSPEWEGGALAFPIAAVLRRSLGRSLNGS